MRHLSLMLIVALALAGGCGYRAPDAGDAWIGQNGKTLYVALFANRTAEPYLDNYVTEQVVVHLSRARQFELTEQRQSADLVLEGVVSRFVSRAAAFSRSDRIEEYQVAMDVRVRLIDTASDQLLWEETLQRSERYPAARDKNVQLEEQASAARTVATRLAEDLSARLYDVF